jgi:transposase
VIIFVDGAGWHTTKELILPENISIAFLPPYSPELNPADHLWDCIRKNRFPNKTFNSPDAVEDTLVEALLSLEKDPARVQRLTGFHWIVHNILNATQYNGIVSLHSSFSLWGVIILTMFQF